MHKCLVEDQNHSFYPTFFFNKERLDCYNEIFKIDINEMLLIANSSKFLQMFLESF